MFARCAQRTSAVDAVEQRVGTFKFAHGFGRGLHDDARDGFHDGQFCSALRRKRFHFQVTATDVEKFRRPRFHAVCCFRVIAPDRVMRVFTHRALSCRTVPSPSSDGMMRTRLPDGPATEIFGTCDAFWPRSKITSPFVTSARNNWFLSFTKSDRRRGAGKPLQLSACPGFNLRGLPF